MEKLLVIEPTNTQTNKRYNTANCLKFSEMKRSFSQAAGPLTQCGGGDYTSETTEEVVKGNVSTVNAVSDGGRLTTSLILLMHDISHLKQADFCGFSSLLFSQNAPPTPPFCTLDTTSVILLHLCSLLICVADRRA